MCFEGINSPRHIRVFSSLIQKYSHFMTSDICFRSCILAAFASCGVSDLTVPSLPHPSSLGGFGTASLWAAECPSYLLLGREQEGTLNNWRSQDMWALAQQRSSLNKIIRKVILLTKLSSSSWNVCRVTMCVRGFLDRSWKSK